MALAILMVAPLTEFQGLKIAGAWTREIAALMLVLVAVSTYGAPSLRRVTQDFDSRFGAMTTDIVSTGARVIVGEYWTVWPSVYHANLTLYALTGRNDVYGLTDRPIPTTDLWLLNKTQPLLLAAPRQDPSVDYRASRIGLSIRKLEQTGSLDLYLAENK